MNFYVSVINDTVEYIENNVSEKLSLADVAVRFSISGFHFNRMFSTVAGISLKQYILGRKLTRAMEQLKHSDKTVIEIALEHGFEYPEVFSRAFKKQFGMAPIEFRCNKTEVDGIEKICMVERDIINYRGTLALKGRSQMFEDFSLRGISLSVNINADDFKQNLQAKADNFLLDSNESVVFIQDKFYTAVSCNGKDDGEYTVFCGKVPVNALAGKDLKELIIPGGWYVSFEYKGDMYDIREPFIDDLYRWIMVKEAELNPNGIGMLNIYNRDYHENKTVQILVPVKKPV